MNYCIFYTDYGIKQNSDINPAFNKNKTKFNRHNNLIIQF